jgi:NADH:ubiquinone oxidoreductase subunit E
MNRAVQTTVDDILREFGPERRALVNVLHRVQETYGYLPQDAIRRIAARFRISESEIYGVLTFYSAFSLTPKGRNVVKVCLGTACHVRGGAQIADEIGRQLSLSPGRTSSDGLFTLETVNCLGCCAIGPVVLINDEYYGHVTIQQVPKILDKFRAAGEGETGDGRRAPASPERAEGANG